MHITKSTEKITPFVGITYFDALMIIVMAGLLSILAYFSLSELYFKFSMIPLLVFYFAGQFVQRKFRSANQ